MKTFLYTHLEGIITSILLVLGALFLLASFHSVEWGGYFSNISAGCVSSIVTIWGVEYLRKNREKNSRSEMKFVADQEVKKLKNMLISYMVGPMGFNIYDYEYKPSEYANVLDWGHKTLARIVDNMIAIDVVKVMKGMSEEDWKSFAINASRLKENIREAIYVYADICSPEITGKIIKIRTLFNDIDNQFALFTDLFTKPEAEWPKNKLGIQHNRKIKDGQIAALADSFKEYFSEIKNLIGMIG